MPSMTTPPAFDDLTAFNTLSQPIASMTHVSMKRRKIINERERPEERRTPVRGKASEQPSEFTQHKHLSRRADGLQSSPSRAILRKDDALLVKCQGAEKGVERCSQGLLL